MPPEPWNPAPTRHGSRALSLPTTAPTSRNDPPGQTDGPSRTIEASRDDEAE
jgi:hypothetical protein